MRPLFTLLPLILLLACSNNSAVEEKLQATEEELATAQEEIEQLQSQLEQEGQLVHLVFFKLKPDADQETLVTEINKLKTIQEVMDLEVGPFEDLSDPRALSDYSMVMSMEFKNAQAYEAYQQHPIHQALKANTIEYMAGPPATYDFVKK